MVARHRCYHISVVIVHFCGERLTLDPPARSKAAPVCPSDNSDTDTESMARSHDAVLTLPCKTWICWTVHTILVYLSHYCRSRYDGIGSRVAATCTDGDSDSTTQTNGHPGRTGAISADEERLDYHRHSRSVVHLHAAGDRQPRAGARRSTRHARSEDRDHQHRQSRRLMLDCQHSRMHGPDRRRRTCHHHDCGASARQRGAQHLVDRSGIGAGRPQFYRSL